MIFTCTDCKYCANYAGGYRVFCLHPDLKANNVVYYQPVGDQCARSCVGFKEGDCVNVWNDWWERATAFSTSELGQGTYEAVRAWFEQNDARVKEVQGECKE